MAEGHDVLSLEVVTRTGVALRADAEEVQAPSVAGEFGVLPGHLPLLAALKSGVLTYRAKGAEAKRAVIGPGFAEVGPDKVLVLCEHWVAEENIDPDAVKAALETDSDALDKLVESGVTEGARHKDLSARVEWLSAQVELSEQWAPGRKGRSA